mgnify:CR=1 FL=1
MMRIRPVGIVGANHDLEHVAARARRDAVITHPILQDPIKDPAGFPWQEVTKVACYRLEVNAMTKPMMFGGINHRMARGIRDEEKGIQP